ncbi:MAG: ABC transporter permease, partial [Bacteroidetes bacterium]
MIRNYFTTALRHVKRQPGYAVLNILGLTIGIGSALFILLYLAEETRFDAYHTKADRIYRVSTDVTEPDDHFRWSTTQVPLAPTLKAEFPEVEEYVRFLSNGRTRLQLGDRYFFEEKVFVVDSTVFNVFDFDFVLGDAATALKEPNSIALSKSVADRIFGYTNPVGEVLKTPSDREYKVTAVYRDMPRHSHLIANAMISANTMPFLMNPSPGSWGGFNNYSYVLLREGADPDAFAAKLPEIIEKYVAVIFNQFNIKIKYELIALKDIHLRSDFEGEAEATGEVGFLYIFGLVALFLVLIASINYMNLATARGIRRSLEVGIRKVLGSNRSQLVGQFLTESLLFTGFAVLLSVLLVLILLPAFNYAFDLQLDRSMLGSPPVLFGLLGIAVLTGVLGGSYPAFFLSGFQPIKVLKGMLTRGTGNPNLRKALVTVQFTITLFMLVGAGVIFDQMDYLRNKDLGFNKEHVLTFALEGNDIREKFGILREKLSQGAGVQSVASVEFLPGQHVGKSVMQVETASGEMDEYGVDLCGVDFDYFSTMGMQIVKGRDMSAAFSTDTANAVIVNETMVRRFGWTDPVGRKFGFDTGDGTTYRQVVGVVKDFHQQSLYEPIQPLMFFPNFRNENVLVRLDIGSSQELDKAIAFTEKTWQEVFPNTPFEYDFVDSAFMELYAADQVRGRIFSLFGVLMIFITCLG